MKSAALHRIGVERESVVRAELSDGYRNFLLR